MRLVTVAWERLRVIGVASPPPRKDVIAICTTPLSHLSIWTCRADLLCVQSASFSTRLRSLASAAGGTLTMRAAELNS